VLQTDSAELREQEKAVKQLREEVNKSSREAVVERVAYLWFNRFCALRFMDVNRYTRIGTVSPAEGFFQPEILQDAKQGHINDELQVDQKKVWPAWRADGFNRSPAGGIPVIASGGLQQLPQTDAVYVPADLGLFGTVATG